MGSATRWRLAVLAWVCSSMLVAACAQAPSGCPADTQSVPVLRVMLRFDPSVDGAAGQTVQRLRDLSGGCVQRLSAVAPTVHVYAFSGVPSVPVLHQRLQDWPAILDVQGDARAQPAAGGTMP